MISNLFYPFGKQQELQSRVKGQIPKKWLQVRTWLLWWPSKVLLFTTYLLYSGKIDYRV